MKRKQGSALDSYYDTRCMMLWWSKHEGEDMKAVRLEQMYAALMTGRVAGVWCFDNREEDMLAQDPKLWPQHGWQDQTWWPLMELQSPTSKIVSRQNLFHCFFYYYLWICGGKDVIGKVQWENTRIVIEYTYVWHKMISLYFCQVVFVTPCFYNSDLLRLCVH